MNRRHFLQLTAAASTTAALLPAVRAVAAPNPLRLIVDADTANEIDDAFALARAQAEPRFQIEGITSAQWHTEEDLPPENRRRPISLRAEDDVNAMRDDFCQAFDPWMSGRPRATTPAAVLP
jgi:hypothetical protein